MLQFVIEHFMDVRIVLLIIDLVVRFRRVVRYQGTYYHQPEEIGVSETLVLLYQTTWRHILEDLIFKNSF